MIEFIGTALFIRCCNESQIQSELALRNGAEFVVGPLSKRNVKALADSNAIATTTLALNYLNDNPRVPVNFFQFSLSPEHESATIARYALSEGMTRSIALIPETTLGQRLLASFTAAFEAGGGKMLDAGAYDPAAKDFGLPITNLLRRRFFDYAHGKEE